MKKTKQKTADVKSASDRERFAAAACRQTAAELEKILLQVKDKRFARNIADVEIELRHIASILEGGQKI